MRYSPYTCQRHNCYQSYRRRTFLPPHTSLSRAYSCYSVSSIRFQLSYRTAAVSILVGLTLSSPGDLQDGVESGQRQAI